MTMEWKVGIGQELCQMAWTSLPHKDMMVKCSSSRWESYSSPC